MKKIVFIVMGLVIAASGRGVVGEEATRAPVPQPAWPDVVLDSPVDYQVVQRGASGAGTIVIKGHLRNTGAMKVEARALGDQGEVKADWREISLGVDATFSGELTVPARGWYRLQVRAPAVTEHKSIQSEVQHVGVGEVFVVGGQSNSTNWGEVKTKSETGMVTVFDGKEWTVAADPLPGVDAGQGRGSPWCAFGDLMYKRLGVPIGIVPVGKGSTSVRQWLPKGDVVEVEPTRTYGMKKNAEGKWESEGTLYDRMVERMKELGPHGFRAMLWHQGESDAHQGAGHTLAGKEYRAMLERVIGESRKAVGWEVPWFVATATWGSPTSPEDPDIRGAQAGVVADGFAMAGPDTDQLIGENRQKNGTGVHMSEKGLRAHGGMWAEIVGKWIEGIQYK